MPGKYAVPGPATVPVWRKPVSTFGLSKLTMFTERSPGLTLPSTLAPPRLVLPVVPLPHGPGTSRMTVGTLSAGLLSA